MDSSPGQILSISGPSSVGKSTIAKALLALADERPWYHIEVDLLHRARSKGHRNAGEFLFARRAFIRIVGDLANIGGSVIADHIIDNDLRPEYLRFWRPHTVLEVNLTCRQQILERRRSERSNRSVSNLYQVRTPPLTSGALEIDTSECSPDNAARQIFQLLNQSRSTINWT